MKPKFVISCPIDTYSGYGSYARDLVKSIIEMDKYDVKIMPQRWGATPWGFIEAHPEWQFLNSHLLPAGQPLNERPEIWAQITIPNEFQPVGKYNIGFTAGIECSAVHGSWIEGCNRMNIVFTSSEFSKNVFEAMSYEVKDNQGNLKGNLKLTTPIKVIFEGADINLYKPLDIVPKNELTDTLNSIPESFAYLFVGHWIKGEFGEDRKNVGLLIKAFYEIFKNKKNPPALILKTSGAGSSYMDRDDILKKIELIKNTVNSNTLPNVYLLHGEFTDKEINQLYNHPKVKAMVSFTKGEGFGRPLLEFSLTKKPILTTNWSSHIEFLSPEFTTLVNGELKPVHSSVLVDNIIIPEAQWFNIDTGEAGKYLKDIFENYKPYKEKANRQAYRSRTEFSYEKMKQDLDIMLSELIPEFPKEVQLELPKLQLPKLQKLNG